jgi:hypothetical protein
VNNERVKLNQTKAKNEHLRREIDGLRKELTSAVGEVTRLKGIPIPQYHYYLYSEYQENEERS